MLGISLTKIPPRNPDPYTEDNESEKLINKIENNNKINFKTTNLVLIPSNNFTPISIRKIGIKYAAKPKKTKTRLEVIAR